MALVRQGMEVSFRTSGGGDKRLPRQDPLRRTGGAQPEPRRDRRGGVLEPDARAASGHVRHRALALGEQALPAVPAKAVRADGTLKHVFVATGGRLEDRLMQAGENVGGEVTIVSGVKTGEQVVAELNPDVRDGAKVK